MKKYTLVFAFFVFLNITSCAYADEASENQLAQKEIDKCWVISKEDRDSGVTSRMRQGALNSALCMERYIIKFSEDVLFRNSPQYVEEMKQDLEKLRFSYGGIYWNLYNSLDACYSEQHGRQCGTVNHVVHNGAYAKLLEEIIYDMHKQVERYSQN